MTHWTIQFFAINVKVVILIRGSVDFLGTVSHNHTERQWSSIRTYDPHTYLSPPLRWNSLKVLSGIIILNERLQRSIVVLRRRTRGFKSTDSRCVRLGGRRNNKQMNETYTSIPIIIHPPTYSHIAFNCTCSV